MAHEAQKAADLKTANDLVNDAVDSLKQARTLFQKAGEKEADETTLRAIQVINLLSWMDLK